MTNTFLLWKNMGLFWGTLSKEVKLHDHPAVQLVFGVHEPFLHKTPSGEWAHKHGLLIGANQKHECDASDKMIFSLKIEPESLLGESISQQLTHKNPLISLPQPFSHYFEIKQLNHSIQSGNYPFVHQKIMDFFEREMNLSLTIVEKDPRITTAIHFLKENYSRPISTQELLDITFLSESRFLHLFKEQTGLAVRNFIHWCKIQHAIKAIMNGANFTEAAYDAGFSDSAHLSRTFTKMTGTSPKTALKNSRIVQVFVEE